MGDKSFKYNKNCVGKGLSKFNSFRVFAKDFASLRWPMVNRAGSAGNNTKNNINTMVTTPKSTKKLLIIFLSKNENKIYN
jgi:hypothetical protein